MANQEHLMFTLDFHWMLFVCPLHDDYIPKRDGETAWTRLEQIMIMTKEEWDTDRWIPYEAEEDGGEGGGGWDRRRSGGRGCLGSLGESGRESWSTRVWKTRE